MLTIRENLLETIKGGKPDRFVDQYEYLELIADPIISNAAGFCPIGETIVNDWGWTISYPEHEPGPFPVHTPDKIVLKDITKWKDVVKAPDPRKYPEEMWAEAVAQAEATDRNEKFVAPMFVTGILEKLHYFMGMTDAMMAFYEEPEALKEFINFLADWEIECAKVEIEHYHPDALFHHDDWGSQRSLFISPEMFEEFLFPAYKKVYGFWKENGAEIIVHHSDSYAAELVPYMIEMGIDIFQGAVYDNNIPELIKTYGPKISIHGGLDNGKYDKVDWSQDHIREGLKDLFETAGSKYIIPGFTMGGPGTTFEGAYEAASEEISKFSEKYFK